MSGGSRAPVGRRVRKVLGDLVDVWVRRCLEVLKRSVPMWWV